MPSLNKHFFAGAFVLATLPLTSHATIISGYGVSASTTTASNCPSYCTTSGGGNFERNSSGGEFSVSATAQEESYAKAKSFASFSDAGYLPQLKVQTEADAGKGGFASAFASQGFTNTSDDLLTISLNLNLHGSVGHNDNGYENNSLRSDIAIFSEESIEFYDDIPTLASEFGYDMIGDVTSLFINDGDDVNVGELLTFDIEAGESFFIAANLYASSKNGYVDAWNTLTVDFTDLSVLNSLSIASSPVVASVPEPSGILLLSVGLAGLVLRRKKLTLS